VIALDAHGADGGLDVIAEGARRSGVPVRVYGPAAAPELAGLDVVDAPDAIGNEEESVRAVRAKENASIVRAARAVAAGEADGLVSAGSTGAALAASVVHVRRIRGVHRPAVAVLLPVPGRDILLLDAGANNEVRPEHLVQFAYLGSAFMEAVRGVERPRVGLLSNGEEPGKGTPDVVAAHERLVAAARLAPNDDGSAGDAGVAPLNFVGNVEGSDLTGGELDVVVTDGFTGNVALKAIEGTSRTVVRAIREAITSSPISSVGGLLIRGRVGRLRDEIDPNTVGGAILLGLRGVAVIAHGGSTPDGIANALRLAQRANDERMIERTQRALEAAGVLRSAPTGSFDSQ
jgi:glycerol-3-phosphate acyltransferase PlsX